MKKIIFLLAVGLSLCFSSQAQTSTGAKKFGYVNSDELLRVMPEAKKADSTLQAFVKSMDEQYKAMLSEGQKKYADYTANESKWSEVVKESKEKEMEDLQNRIQEFQSTAEEKIGNKRVDIYKPLLEKAQNAIKAVGEEGGYDYIFDAAQLLYVKDSENITSKVKTKLGIK